MSGRAGFRPIGLLVNGIEFIPNDIVEKHTPFIVPPGTTCVAVYVEDEPADVELCLAARMDNDPRRPILCHKPKGHDGMHGNDLGGWA